MAGRTIAIGDIHGCGAALSTLIEAIAPSPEDTLITLGDYIDRGPDSRGVLDLLIALAGRCRLVPLLGNHEEMLVAAVRDHPAFTRWLFNGGLELLASYGVAGGWEYRPGWLTTVLPKPHWDFLAACQPFHENDTHLFVHAGYVPDLPMDQQPDEVLRWQYVDRRKARPHCSGKTAIVGHEPQEDGEVLDLGFLKCIDTACESGRWLTALHVDTGKVWQADREGRLRER